MNWRKHVVVRFVIVGGIAAFGIVATAVVEAQSSLPPSVQEVAATNTDTGDFAPTRDFLAHHNTPQLCLAAVGTTEKIEWRTYRMGVATLRQRETPLSDTIPAKSIAVARQCLAQFSGRSVPLHDLQDMFRLALLAGQDTLARTFADRWLAGQSDADAHDRVLLLMDSLYLSARPARPTAAAELLGRVKSTDDRGDKTRLGLMTRHLQFWSMAYDPSQMRQWADQVLALLLGRSRRALSGGDWAIGEAYQARAKIAYADRLDSLTTLAELARDAWRRLPRDTVNGGMRWDPVTAPVADIVRHISPVTSEPGTAINEKYPPVTAQYWFPAKPNVVPNASLPVTLVVTPFEQCFTDDIAILYRPMQMCVPTYEWIRHVATQYASNDLRVIVLTATQGNALRSVPIPVAKEADELRWYILDYLKLPVTLGVVDRPSFQMPAPDLRRWPLSACNPGWAMVFGTDSSVVACNYLSKPVVLLGHKGELLYAGEQGAYFDTLLAQVMGQFAAMDQRREEHHQ